MRYITAQQLEAAGACTEAVAPFRKRCGEKTVVTERKCAAVAYEFNWNWAAEHLLTASLAAEYCRQRAPILAEYERQLAVLWARLYRAM